MLPRLEQQPADLDVGLAALPVVPGPAASAVLGACCKCRLLGPLGRLAESASPLESRARYWPWEAPVDSKALTGACIPARRTTSVKSLLGQPGASRRCLLAPVTYVFHGLCLLEVRTRACVPEVREGAGSSSPHAGLKVTEGGVEVLQIPGKRRCVLAAVSGFCVCCVRVGRTLNSHQLPGSP